MEKTIKNLLIAQNYDKAANDFDPCYIDIDLHQKQIKKIINHSNTYEIMRNDLLKQKGKFIQKACRSAKTECINVIFDECIIYFEFPFGRVSLHLFIHNYSFFKNIKNVKFASHEYSELINSRNLLSINYNKLTKNRR